MSEMRSMLNRRCSSFSPCINFSHKKKKKKNLQICSFWVPLFYMLRNRVLGDSRAQTLSHRRALSR